MAEFATGQCSATARTTGNPCKMKPEAGAVVCWLHGGRLPKVKQAAKFRLARDKAQQEALQRLKADGASRQDVVTEMDRLAAEVIVFKDVCRERLEQLLELGELRYEGKTGEQLRAEVALYERALDRCNTVLSTNVKLNIAERKQKLDEAQAMLMVGVVKTILNRLDLTPEQKRIAIKVVPEEMRAISAAVQSS
jgi:hypothetical protein